MGIFDPKQWTNNQTPIDAANLNRIEQGIHDASFPVNDQLAEPIDMDTFRNPEHHGWWLIRQNLVDNGPDLGGYLLGNGTEDILWAINVTYGNSSTAFQEMHARTDHFEGYFRRGSYGSSSFGPWEYYGENPITEWHVFLAAGQSNMSGRGVPIGSGLDTPNPRVLEFGSRSDSKLRVAEVPLEMADPDAPSGLSPATVFAHEYIKNMPDHIGVVLVPAARGSSGFNPEAGQEFRSWIYKPRPFNQSSLNLYQRSVLQLETAMSKLGNRGKLMGVLWHQGEHDVDRGAAWYESNIDDLIAGYRAEFGISNLPFVLGQMNPDGMDDSARDMYAIDAVHQETPAREIRTGFAPAEHNWSGEDTTHFGRYGVEQLGARYFDAYRRALKNEVSSEPLPPINLKAEFLGDDQTILTWEAPYTRYTHFTVERRRAGSSSWESITRSQPVHMFQELSATTGDQIRVTTRAATKVSIPAQIYV